jgi:hypothetical protein
MYHCMLFQTLMTVNQTAVTMPMVPVWTTSTRSPVDVTRDGQEKNVTQVNRYINKLSVIVLRAMVPIQQGIKNNSIIYMHVTLYFST